MKRTNKSWLLYLLVLVVTLGVVVWYATRPKPIVVQLFTVQRGMVEATVNNTRAGTIKACRRAKLSPPMGGQITRLLVKKGDKVQAGQVLLELWNDDLQAQAQLAQMQLKTVTIRATEVCTLAELSAKELARARVLHDKEFVATDILQRAEADAKAKQASCDAVRSEIAQNRSRIDLAQAGLRRVVLKAPFTGVVADISGELGEYTTPSPPGVATPAAIDLIDDSCLYVSAPIDEVDAAKVRVGQSSRITLDAIKGKSFAGKVKRIAPYVLELEKQARTVEVEVEFVDAPSAEKMLVGYSADVEIVHQQRVDVVRIPSTALLDGKRVLLYGSDGVLQEKTIEPGLANWEQTEVLRGLNAGDQIVLSLDKPGVKAGALVQAEK